MTDDAPADWLRSVAQPKPEPPAPADNTDDWLRTVRRRPAPPAGFTRDSAVFPNSTELSKEN